MPLIRATLVENAITPRMRPYTWVLIDEIKSGQFGAGGHGFTTEEIQALMAGDPALTS